LGRRDFEEPVLHEFPELGLMVERLSFGLGVRCCPMCVQDRDPSSTQVREHAALIAEPHHDWLDRGRRGCDGTCFGDALIERNFLIAYRNVSWVVAEGHSPGYVPERPFRCEASSAELVEE